MAWYPVHVPKKVDKAVLKSLKRRSRFLVDENLGSGTAEVLRDVGYDAIFVRDIGLGGHSDGAVFALAWRQQRILLSHDHDFLSDRHFPEHRNPGVIILPGASGDVLSLEQAIAVALILFGQGPHNWRGAKIFISPDREVHVRSRHADGKMRTIRYRSVRRGPLEEYQDDHD